MNNILSIKRTRKLDFSKDEVWNVITTPNYLNETHPFCKNNTVVTWPGVGSKDILEYLSGLTFEREFTQWNENGYDLIICLLYTSPSPRDRTRSRMPSSA